MTSLMHISLVHDTVPILDKLAMVFEKENFFVLKNLITEHTSQLTAFFRKCCDIATNSLSGSANPVHMAEGLMIALKLQKPLVSDQHGQGMYDSYLHINKRCHWLFTLVAQVPFQLGSCGVCSRWSGSWTCFIQVISVLFANNYSTNCYTFINNHITYPV
jgi:hypothetical protein